MNCKNLQTVWLGEGISYVSNEMFYNCTALQNVSLPNSLQYIGNLALVFAQASNHYNCPKHLKVWEIVYFLAANLFQILNYLSPYTLLALSAFMVAKN